MASLGNWKLQRTFAFVQHSFIWWLCLILVEPRVTVPPTTLSRDTRDLQLAHYHAPALKAARDPGRSIWPKADQSESSSRIEVCMYIKYTHLHLAHSTHSVLPFNFILNIPLMSFYVSTCRLNGSQSLNTLLTMAKSLKKNHPPKYMCII